MTDLNKRSLIKAAALSVLAGARARAAEDRLRLRRPGG
jgi:hypothetical protein